LAPKKIPMRMCVGCRQMCSKKDLIRIVRSADGQIHMDLTGKAAGRGAYLCKEAQCLEKAIKIKALERAFEQKIEDDLYEQLKEEFMAL